MYHYFGGITSTQQSVTPPSAALPSITLPSVTPPSVTPLGFFILLLLLLCGCSDSSTIADSGETESCSPGLKTVSIQHNNLQRSYIRYIPDSYDGTTPYPVVLNFHGYGGRAQYHIIQANMRPEADSGNFILIYPQGSEIDGVPHWNACPAGEDNKSPADDFGFTQSLLNHLASTCQINPERTFATGYSNGGMMSYGLAHHRSELIAGVASVSGVMLDCTGTPRKPTPVLHLHGTSDAIVPYNGNDSFESAQSVLDYWIDFNQTSDTPVITVDNSNSSGISVEHYLYTTDTGNSTSPNANPANTHDVTVEHYKYVGGGHNWFRETFEGKDASALIWEFFSRIDE